MTTWTIEVDSGQGWEYDQQQITYDGLEEPATGNALYYDGAGVATAWTYTNKN